MTIGDELDYLVNRKILEFENSSSAYHSKIKEKICQFYRIGSNRTNVKKTYCVGRFDWVGYPVFVVGDDPEGVARRGDQVLVGDGVLLDGAPLRPGLGLPFIFI